MSSRSIDDRWHVIDPGTGKVVRSARYGRGARWRARYRTVAGGKQFTKSFDRKVDAQRWLDEVTTSLNTGTYASPEKGRTTFVELADAWYQGHPEWAETTRARNRSVLDNHVLPVWGCYRVADIDHEAIECWVRSLPGSAASVRKAFGVLAGVLDLAVDRRCIAVSPARGRVELPRQRLAPRRYLNHRQVEDLTRQAGEQGRCIILVLSFCGLRIGELAGLRVSDVNVARRRLTIERSVTEVNGRLVWSSPKDGQRRSVPVPMFVMEEIETLIEGKDGTDLVFASPDGHVLRVRNMRRSWFDDAAQAAGLAGLVPHELRHTAASLAVSAGASVLAVQRMLGHSKPSITLDTYSDLFDADLDHVADRLHAQRLEQLRTG